MIKFILGISITLNILSIIGYIIIYKYSLKKIKHNIENYVLDNFMEIDIGGGKDDNKSTSKYSESNNNKFIF